MLSTTIYIIDDEDEVRSTIENVFHFAGFNVTSFKNAKSALNAELKTENSCIILDLEMPEIDGLQFHKLLQDKGSGIPVVFYTGKADVDSAVCAMSGGAYTLIRKPAPNQVLIEKVLEAITNFQKSDVLKSQSIIAAKTLEILSERETEVAKLVASGDTANAIAEQLFISRRTVEAHRASILGKLKIKSIARLAQLIMLADMKKH